MLPSATVTLFPSAAEAAKGCELVFTSVPGPDDVDKVGAQLKDILAETEPTVVAASVERVDAAVELALASYPGFTMTAPPGRGCSALR